MLNDYQILADLVLVIHFLFVAFVILGLLLTLLGGYLNWMWVRNPIFRLTHLIAIGVVTLQSWLGFICPLTHLENWLRWRANQSEYSSSFVQHWLERLLYYQAEPWVFVLVYSLFGVLVIAVWLRFPPVKDTQKK